MLVFGFNALGYLLELMEMLFWDGQDKLFYLKNLFINSSLFSIEVIIQSLLTEQYSSEINQVNGAFRAWFSIGGVWLGLVHSLWSHSVSGLGTVGSLHIIGSSVWAILQYKNYM